MTQDDASRDSSSTLESILLSAGRFKIESEALFNEIHVVGREQILGFSVKSISKPKVLRNSSVRAKFCF